MPPSGYISSEANLIKDFAHSNAERLAQEAHAQGISYKEKIAQEMNDITRCLTYEETTTAQKAALYTSLALYEILSSASIDTQEEYESAVQNGLQTIAQEVEQFTVH